MAGTKTEKKDLMVNTNFTTPDVVKLSFDVWLEMTIYHTIQTHV